MSIARPASIGPPPAGTPEPTRLAAPASIAWQQDSRGATGVPLDGLGNGAPGTNFVRMFSGEILAGPASAMLSKEPKNFAAAQKQLAADEKKWAREPKKAGAAQRTLAAAQRTLAAHVRLVNGPSASGELAAKLKGVRLHVGHLHPRR